MIDNAPLTKIQTCSGVCTNRPLIHQTVAHFIRELFTRKLRHVKSNKFYCKAWLRKHSFNTKSSPPPTKKKREKYLPPKFINKNTKQKSSHHDKRRKIGTVYVSRIDLDLHVTILREVLTGLLTTHRRIRLVHNMDILMYKVNNFCSTGNSGKKYWIIKFILEIELEISHVIMENMAVSFAFRPWSMWRDSLRMIQIIAEMIIFMKYTVQVQSRIEWYIW
jgi:hypothetical protein